MLADFLQDRAALYVSGAMSATEREGFELVLAFHHELQEHVAQLQEAAAIALCGSLKPVTPPPALRARLLAAVGAQPVRPQPDALVVADPEGRVEWVNDAFLALCGHSLEEIRGRKPGQILQGPATDPVAVARLRTALAERRPCREQLVNYHKSGSPYRVDVAITPILDDAGALRWFIARERELPLAAAS